MPFSEDNFSTVDEIIKQAVELGFNRNDDNSSAILKTENFTIGIGYNGYERISQMVIRDNNDIVQFHKFLIYEPISSESLRESLNNDIQILINRFHDKKISQL